MNGSIAIIGAGLGDLAAALALQQAGWCVRVYEQADTLSKAEAGITINSGTGRALANLGLGPPCWPHRCPPPAWP